MSKFFKVLNLYWPVLGPSEIYTGQSMSGPQFLFFCFEEQCLTPDLFFILSKLDNKVKSFPIFHF